MTENDNSFEDEKSIEQKLIEEKSLRNNDNNDEQKNEKEKIFEKDANYYIDGSNLFDSIKLYENKKENKPLGSEEVFINIKNDIEKIKKRNKVLSLKKQSNSINYIDVKNSYNNSFLNKSSDFNNNFNIDNIINKINPEIDKNEKLNEKNYLRYSANRDNNTNTIIEDLQIFSLNDYNLFEYTKMSFNLYNEEKSPFLDIDNEWHPLKKRNKLFFSNEDPNTGISYNYMKINKYALKFVKEIDYNEKGIELNINFNLIDQSEFWIFTRSFVNKSINENFYFDEESQNIDENDKFNKYSSLIRIIKDNNMNRCYISFGTFYNEANDNNKLYYKSFLKRQLIDYSFNNNDYNKSEFNITINDLGEETIKAKIFFNNRIKSNDINGNFFLPLNKRAKILFCGIGKSVELNDLKIKIFDKEKYGKTLIKFESENDVPKSCECCTIL